MRHLLLFSLLPLTLLAKLNIAVTYPYIGEIADRIGQENTTTVVLAKGEWDPHFVIPRPSLISKVRNADAIIINGGQLEIGWLPPLLQRSGNPKLQVNSKHFLNLFQHIEHINKPLSVDRAHGDVHPDGNPHFHLDPHNILVLAEVVKNFLISLDPSQQSEYEKNYASFKNAWEEKLQTWQKKMKDKKGLKVIQYHNNLAYFNKRYGIESVAMIEPLPGVTPSSKHTLGLIKLIKDQGVCCILHDVYHPKKAAKFIQSKTGVKLITMPHDVDAQDEIDSLESLFDHLTGAIQ